MFYVSSSRVQTGVLITGVVQHINYAYFTLILHYTVTKCPNIQSFLNNILFFYNLKPTKLFLKYLDCMQLSHPRTVCCAIHVRPLILNFILSFLACLTLTYVHLHVEQVVSQRFVWNRRRVRFEEPRCPWQLPGPTQQEECGRFLPVCQVQHFWFDIIISIFSHFLCHLEKIWF